MSRRTLVPTALTALLLLGLTAGSALAAPPVHTFATVLIGEAEVPGPGDADGVGHAVVRIWPDSDLVCWNLSWNRLEQTVVAAHIHGPADVDSSAPPIVTFFQGVPHAATDTDRGCTTSAWADAIVAEPWNYYVNVHSVPDHGPGAIRGQLD